MDAQFSVTLTRLRTSTLNLPPRHRVGVVAVWSVVCVSLLIPVLLHLRLHADAAAMPLLDVADAISLLPVLSTLIVGTALTSQRPTHPVGWLFLLFGVVQVVPGAIDVVTEYLLATRATLPGAVTVLAALSDISFVCWLTLLALILLLTPGGELCGRLEQVTARLVVAACVVAMLGGMLRPYQGLFADTGRVTNPLAVPTVQSLGKLLALSGVVVVHVGVLLAVVVVVRRYRASSPEMRPQLRWLRRAALPFLLLVALAYVAAVLDIIWLLWLSAMGFAAILPIAVGLAIEREHLFDIERLVSRGVSWLLLTATLVGTYIVVVFLSSRALGQRVGDSPPPVILATLAAVSVFGPARRGLQDRLNRHFQRERHDALATLRQHLRHLQPSVGIEHLLRAALQAPHLSVAYWIAERGSWVTESGRSATPAADAILLSRHGQVAYALTDACTVLKRATVEAVVTEALAELENARLQAAITLQLVEVQQSRARIVAAQLAERHRIERDLHDGAQQRLLALALDLRTADLSQQPERIQRAAQAAIDEVQIVIQELRDLAHGLLPVALRYGGLAVALDELAARTPVIVRVDTAGARYPASVEETAWFIACEAVANAVKHAAPASVTIRATHCGERLRLEIEDDGHGGADPAGHGLRGLADRAEAIGGWLTVHERGGRGTIVTAELPCASA